MPVRPRSPAPYRGVEQLVARRAHNPEVGGSSPPPATRKKYRNQSIAVLFCFFQRNIWMPPASGRGYKILRYSIKGSAKDGALTRSTVNLEADKFAVYLDRSDLDIL